jgi:thiol-disulfide isomerase/thioredoxin
MNPDAGYITLIDKEYGKWEKVAQGNPAPDFSYQAPEGETVALSDFKGKVVYVDVWATWCGPCRAEFPHSKTLKKQYEGKDVVFMYVSVDDSEDAWRNMLENDPEFAGVHVITGSAWDASIVKDYNISGIPRYILVDRDGKVVSASAPRPSSGEKLTTMIDEQLAKDAISMN